MIQAWAEVRSYFWGLWHIGILGHRPSEPERFHLVDHVFVGSVCSCGAIITCRIRRR